MADECSWDTAAVGSQSSHFRREGQLMMQLNIAIRSERVAARLPHLWRSKLVEQE